MVPNTMVTRKVISQPEMKERKVKQATAVFFFCFNVLGSMDLHKVGQHQTSTGFYLSIGHTINHLKKSKNQQIPGVREKEREKDVW